MKIMANCKVFANRLQRAPCPTTAEEAPNQISKGFFDFDTEKFRGRIFLGLFYENHMVLQLWRGPPNTKSNFEFAAPAAPLRSAG